MSGESGSGESGSAPTARAEFHPALVVRAEAVRAGDGLVGGAHWAGAEPKPYLVTKSSWHGDSRTLRRIELHAVALVLDAKQLVVVQRESDPSAPGTGASSGSSKEAE